MQCNTKSGEVQSVVQRISEVEFIATLEERGRSTMQSITRCNVVQSDKARCIFVQKAVQWMVIAPLEERC